jgi:hypothetical protein
MLTKIRNAFTHAYLQIFLIEAALKCSIRISQVNHITMTFAACSAAGTTIALVLGTIIGGTSEIIFPGLGTMVGGAVGRVIGALSLRRIYNDSLEFWSYNTTEQSSVNNNTKQPE